MAADIEVNAVRLRFGSLVHLPGVALCEHFKTAFPANLPDIIMRKPRHTWFVSKVVLYEASS